MKVLRPGDVDRVPDGHQVSVAGRIRGVRPHGALTFYDLTWGGASIQVVGRPPIRLGRLDLVVLQGTVRRTECRPELELASVAWRSSPRDRCRSDALPLLSEDRTVALTTRAAVERSARSILDGLGFVPVRSPGIVGDWAKGQTGAFDLTYYGRAAHLTISNMLSHQILLGSGIGDVYELGPVFRAETPRSRKRLADFTILDIGMSFADLDDLLAVEEDCVRGMCTALRTQHPERDVPVPPGPFPRVAYSDLLSKAGLERTSGAQLPAQVRNLLATTYDGFVWVVGFPARTRPFFVKARDGVCMDAQLWYRGRIYLAAGGERETSPDEMIRRIEAEGKNPQRYEFFLQYLEAGLPPSAGMGMGLERFLATLLDGAASDFAAFPEPLGRLPRLASRGDLP